MRHFLTRFDGFNGVRCIVEKEDFSMCNNLDYAVHGWKLYCDVDLKEGGWDENALIAIIGNTGKIISIGLIP